MAKWQRLLSTLHQNEAEVRSLISKAIKQAMEKCHSTDSEKLYAATKGL
jgi:DNA-binding protein YbaB